MEKDIISYVGLLFKKYEKHNIIEMDLSEYINNMLLLEHRFNIIINDEDCDFLNSIDDIIKYVQNKISLKK